MAAALSATISSRIQLIMDHRLGQANTAGLSIAEANLNFEFSPAITAGMGLLLLSLCWISPKQAR
jgi:hypothetical protein